MKKIISLLIIAFLTSCSSVGQFGAGVDITFDPRTIGMQIDDTIMQKNLSARLALADKKYFISIGSLKLVGEGKWEPKKIKEILDKKDRTLCGPVAPAEGLCLEKVDYD